MPLSRLQKAAIIVMNIAPELSAKVMSELSPKELQSLLLMITELPALDQRYTYKTLLEFLGSDSEYPISLDELKDNLEKQVLSNFDAVLRKLKRLVY